MNTEFIPYQQALELKELGFDEPCFGWYASDKSLIRDYVIKMNLKAPLYQQAFRWFREKYKIGTWIHHYFDMDKGNFQYSWIITLPYKDDGYVYETYEEAELACLIKLIEIVKQEKK